MTDQERIPEGHVARPLSKGKILAITAGGIIAGTLIVCGAILPAEYNRDPLGLGRLTGLDRLWAPPEVEFDLASSAVPLVRDYDRAFRSDTVEIPLASGDDRRRGNELEYKVHMAEGATLLYEWRVEPMENAQEFYYDFHGHTAEVEGEEMTVATYTQATGASAQGALTAPFEGVHGWYFQNQSVEPVIVYLKISGFYDLIPCCEAGNEAGIIANVPAAEAFGNWEDVPPTP
jgi:hypothetical protein